MAVYANLLEVMLSAQQRCGRGGAECSMCVVCDTYTINIRIYNTEIYIISYLCIYIFRQLFFNCVRFFLKFSKIHYILIIPNVLKFYNIFKFFKIFKISL